jgi:hypothetical protein
MATLLAVTECCFFHSRLHFSHCPNGFIGNVSFTPSGKSFDINYFGKVNSVFDPRIVQFVGRFDY